MIFIVNQVKDNQTVENSSQFLSVTNKKTAKEIVKRHLKDKNDIITEDDMKNIKIVTGLSGEEPLEITNNTNRPKDEDKGSRQLTPWETISE